MTLQHKVVEPTTYQHRFARSIRLVVEASSLMKCA